MVDGTKSMQRLPQITYGGLMGSKTCLKLLLLTVFLDAVQKFPEYAKLRYCLLFQCLKV